MLLRISCLLLVLAVAKGIEEEQGSLDIDDIVNVEEDSSITPDVEPTTEDTLQTPGSDVEPVNADLVKHGFNKGGGGGKPSIEVIVSQTTRRPARPPSSYPDDSHNSNNPHYTHYPNNPNYPPYYPPQYPPQYPPHMPYPPYYPPYSYYYPYYGYGNGFGNGFGGGGFGGGGGGSGGFGGNGIPWWWRSATNFQERSSPIRSESNNVNTGSQSKNARESSSALKSLPFWSFLNFGFNKK